MEIKDNYNELETNVNHPTMSTSLNILFKIVPSSNSTIKIHVQIQLFF